MACNCIRKNKEMEEAHRMARIEAKADGVDYVIFKVNGKIYHTKLSCWRKEKDKGVVLALVHP